MMTAINSPEASGFRKKALVVDDESIIRLSLKKFLEDEGFISLTSSTGMDALKKIEEDHPDLVILDIQLPDSNGLNLLKTIKEMNPSITVIMITGHADVKGAVEAMKIGALDYLEKPIDFKNLKETLSRLRFDVQEHATEAEGLITLNPRMKEIYRVAERLATKSDVTILVLGESGTGKNFLCKKLHDISPRRNMPFVEVSCSNIPEHLIESELFGYEKGAFTDAKNLKKGLVEIAHGGTIFLDEIGDMPYPMQSKLLTLIEEKRFRRIGGLQFLRTDVRILAATNKNLQQLVHEGKFRLDLYYRLNVATVELLPLRERKEDIPLLANNFLKHYTEKYSTGKKTFTEQTIEAMQRYSWPGNIRELKNLVEKLVILSKSYEIGIHDLPEYFLKNETTCPSEELKTFERSFANLSLRDIEIECIRKALQIARGNQKKAAELLNISRDTLRYRLKKLGIRASEYKR
ncbi:MAG: sigma-54 dependent transcriptional regulator [Thermodesulfovibrionales bacterium]|nr:sigma-54 dependent transcriptional regulator [Thermodesulfovibrionales bacterium]